MKKYYLEDLNSKEQYCKFINYMVKNSDKFSLVYFKYSENEKVKSTAKEIGKLLKPYKIFSYNGNQWPSTVTLNENNHIYKIYLYKVAPGVKKYLLNPTICLIGIILIYLWTCVFIKMGIHGLLHQLMNIMLVFI